MIDINKSMNKSKGDVYPVDMIPEMKEEKDKKEKRVNSYKDSSKETSYMIKYTFPLVSLMCNSSRNNPRYIRIL